MPEQMTVFEKFNTKPFSANHVKMIKTDFFFRAMIEKN